MDKLIAKHIAVTAFQASADLGNLVPFLKIHSSQEEYERYAKAIAAASSEIFLNIMKKVFQDFPELEEEFDKSIKIYGKIL